MSGLPKVLVVRMIWAAHDVPVIPLRLGARVNDVTVAPEPGYPFGRKGLQMAGAWRQASEPDTAGMLVIDGDVVVDLYDVAAMFGAIEADPGAVHTAPCKIWPRSTGRHGWTWDAWEDTPSQEYPHEISYFSFGFTFLPRHLLELAVKSGLKTWQWPHVDERMARCAREHGISMNVVSLASPKHLNW